MRNWVTRGHAAMLVGDRGRRFAKSQLLICAFLLLALGCSREKPTQPAEQVARSAEALSATTIRTYGFESLSDWSAYASTPALSLSTTHVQGTSSLSVAGGGWSSIRSRILVKEDPAPTTVGFDLRIPSPQPNPTWFGTVQLFVSIPSQNINDLPLGNFDLITWTPGQFKRAEFALPANVQAALNTNFTDLRWRIELNRPTTATAGYLFDRFTYGPLCTPQSDNNACTTDTCDANGNQVHTPVAAGTSCSDNNACNGGETCNATGTCVAGTPPNLNDNNPCTTDACTPAGGVTHTPVAAGASCTDGNACNGAETCNASAVCQAGTPPVVNDNNPCTTDACTPASGVTHTPVAAGTSCADSDQCNGAEACNAAGSCVAGTPVTCTASDQCHNAGTCNPSTGVCTNPAKTNGTACTDGSACTQTDTCQSGICTGANPVVCVASDQCHNAGTCNPTNGACSNPEKPNGSICSDGNACTQTDACQAGTCTGTNPVVCVASNSCHDPGTCAPSTGTCSNPAKPNGTACNDATVCNGSETCTAGTCTAGTPPTTDDGNPCTSDACDPVAGVTHAPISTGTSCSNGNACDGAETCNASASCVAGTPPETNDGNPCTADACDPVAGVTHEPVTAGTLCLDANACNGAETCNATGSCQPGTPPTVDDGNPCTADACDQSSGVTHTPVSAGTSCADANACNGMETCNGGGACVAGTPVTCTASDQCHDVGTCDPGSGTCSNPAKTNGSSCSDGDACTQTDTCQTGTCTGANSVVCSASDQCHDAGTCNAATGTCSNPAKANGTSCTDNDACTQTDSCQSGMCAGANPVVCTASDACHSAGTCSPTTGTCSSPTKADGSACPDGTVCNGAETCSSGSCVSGTPPATDDGNPCTADACDPVTGVSHTPVSAGTSCSNGNVCDGAEVCNGAATCINGTPLTTDDGNPCTADACDPVAGPTHEPLTDVTCDDGDACNGADFCAAGVCTHETSTDDGDPCTVDACDPQTGEATHTPAPEGEPCGNACSGSGACDAFGSCQITGPGAEVEDDQNPCTADTCDPASGATRHDPVAAGTSCDTDSNQCNGTDTCNAEGECVAGTPPSLDDGDPCTVDECVFVGSIGAYLISHSPAPDGTVCGDTDNDRCNGYFGCFDTGGAVSDVECVEVPPFTGSPNPCIVGTCDPATGPTYVPAQEGTVCDAGNACASPGTCSGSGTCRPGTPIDTDGNPCTSDVCEPDGSIVHEPLVGSSCDDGNVCNGVSICDENAACVPQTPDSVDDGNPCTADSCEPFVGIIHVPVFEGTPCGLSTVCEGTPTCDPFAICQPGQPVEVDDGNLCTIDGCDVAGGVFHVPVGAGASCETDGTVCNGVSTCDAFGACVDGTPANADDGNPCTFDACDPVAGVTHTITPFVGCSNQNGCDGLERCDFAGLCATVPGTAPVVNDGNPCTVDACDPATGTVSHAPVAAGAGCDTDANVCNGVGTCNGSGACVLGAPPPLSDSNPCTADTCDPAAGVIHTPLAAGTSCDTDGTVCNGRNTCGAAGTCQVGTPPVVDDGNPCTADACSPLTGVSHTPLGAGANCDSDGNACNGQATCDMAGTCVAGPPPIIDDGNPCTVDACDASTGVSHIAVPVGTSCSNGNVCDGYERCNSHGDCISGTPLEVDDGNGCTIGSCDPVTGAVTQANHPAGSPCTQDACRLSGQCDGSGVCTALGPVTVDDGDACTLEFCDPETGLTRRSCAPLDRTIGSNIFRSMEWLINATPPVQVGVEPGTIEPERASLVRGRATDREEEPLPNVTITVLDHPEFGSTTTRVDGEFDMLVNGGEDLIFEFRSPGFLRASRSAFAPWQEATRLSSVALVRADTHVTEVDLTSLENYQVAQGSVITDGDGQRQATLLFPSLNEAEMVLPDGTVQPITTLHVRATEFTVGASGQAAMPAELPATSAYTYAFELNADEAVALGAGSVRFTEPLIFYTDNFLGFPAGTTVPLGSYDRELGEWIPSDSGVVVSMVGETSGEAEVDVTGDGVADDLPALQAFGITQEELRKIADLYDPGASLWRVLIPHFTSPWDCNWGFAPPPDAEPPPPPTAGSGGTAGTAGTGGTAGSAGTAGSGGTSGTSSGGSAGQGGSAGTGGEPAGPEEPDPCEHDVASSVECENMALRESISVAGTAYSLNYASARTNGRRNSIPIRLSNADMPASVKRIDLDVEVAGRVFDYSFPPVPDQSFTFVFDGRDNFGRSVQGRARARVRISYAYDAYYGEVPRFGYNGNGVPVSGDRARGELFLSQESLAYVGTWDARASGLGGWDLSVHNPYEPATGILRLGTGRNRRAQDLSSNSVRVFAEPDVTGVEPTADGGFYAFAGATIIQSDSSGNVTIVAGTGVPGNTGDGGPANQARIEVAGQALALGNDRSLYLSSISSVRRIDPRGTISTIAGIDIPGGGTDAGDGDPAVDARFIEVTDITVGPDGSLYVVDGRARRVRRIDPAGIIATVLGTGHRADFCAPLPPDGSLAVDVSVTPQRVAVDRSGRLYVRIAEGAVLRVDEFGKTKRLAGCDPAQTSGGCGPGCGVEPDGSAALSTLLTGTEDLTVDPVGNLSIVANAPTLTGTERAIRKVSAGGILGSSVTLPTFCFVDNIAAAPNRLMISAASGIGCSDREILSMGSALPGFLTSSIPSEDGTEIYQFDPDGRHLRTVNALTGHPLVDLAYDGVGRLVGVTDASSNQTRIDYTLTGATITAPFGQQTILAFDGNGYLSSLTDPVGSATILEHDATGLLLSETNARGFSSTVAYDSLGRVATDADQVGGIVTLTPSGSQQDWAVTMQSGEGRVTTYELGELADGSRRRVVTQPDGTEAVENTNRAAGISAIVEPSGLQISISGQPDPRFGMVAPVVSTTSTLPSGLARIVETSRNTTFADPNNLLSIVQQIDKRRINDRQWTTTYTASTRTFLASSPEGRVSSRVIDEAGRTVRIQVAGLLPTDLFYDSHGRLDHVTQGTRTTQKGYFATGDAAGYLSTITDATGVATSSTRDALGRTLTETRANATTAFEWDEVGNLASVTPPGKPTHVMSYTPVNLLESYEPPPAGLSVSATTYGYDFDRMLRAETRANGTNIVRTPDAAGRLDTVALPGGFLDYGYVPSDAPSGAGKTSDIRGPYGTDLHFTYDGSLMTHMSWTGGVTGSVARQYNNDFKKILETVNGATGSASTAFGYDSDLLLTCASPSTCSPSGADALKLIRSPQQGMVTKILLGPTSEAWSYNAYGELARQTATMAGSPLVDITYDEPGFERDALGRIVRKAETILGVTRVFEYHYDDLRRLDRATANGTVQEQFTYDANGNRLTTFKQGVGTVTATYDDQDRLLTSGDWTFTYTANGELQTKTNTATGDEWIFHYDALGSLLSVGLPSGDLVEYTVDGMGRRVGKKKNGVLLKQWLYRDSLRPVAELDAAGNVVSNFAYASKRNVPDYVVRSGVMYRVISDELGSPRYVVNVSNGADVPYRAEYTSFGEVAGAGLDWMPFGFAGGIYDADTKLLRFGHRDLDPSVGRWTVKEPLRFQAAVNFYAYVFNDPINMIDPTGRDPQGTGGANGNGGGEGTGNDPTMSIDPGWPADEEFDACYDYCMESQGADIAADAVLICLPFGPLPKSEWELGKTLAGGSGWTTTASRAASALGLPAKNALRTAGKYSSYVAGPVIAGGASYYATSALLCASECWQ